MSKRKIVEKVNKKVNKKQKKSELSDIDDFGKAYGWALYNSAANWNFHSDSGCFYSICQKEVYTVGDWTAIYQPSKEMKEYDGCKYYLIFKNKKPITEKKFKELNPIILQVEKLFKESYNDILKVTKNRWSTKVNGTIEEIAQIFYPLKLEQNSLKMCFELRGMTNEWRSNDYWIPEKLGQWLGYEKSSLSLFDENGDIKKDIQYDEKDLPEDLGRFTEPAEPAIL
jgi:hypothetical protein